MIQKEPRPTINPGARLPIVTKEPTATTPLTYLHLPPMRWFNNLSVTAKLYAAFGLVALMVFIMGALSMRDTATLNSNLTELYEEDFAAVNAAKEANIRLVAYSRAELNYLLASDDAERSEYRAAMESFADELDRHLAAAQEVATSESARRLIGEIEDEWQTYRGISSDVIQLGATDETSGEALALAWTDGRAQVDDLDTLFTHLNRTAMTEADEAYEAGVSAYQRNWLTAVVLLFVTLGLAGGLGWLLSRALGVPVRRLQEAAERVAAGDLTATSDVHTEDELGQLSTAFNEMVANIRHGQEELEQEKASVERRVQEAVSEARQQQEALNASVDHMLVEMDKFAEGDLRVHLDASGEDAIARLYEGFNRAVQKMRGLIEAIVDTTGSVASASAQISSSTEELAAGAEEQSAQADEVAAAVEQLAATILDNSENATHTARAARASGDTAEDGQAIVQQTVDKMAEIADVVANTAMTIERLNQSSKEIGEIIAVIDEIADQTNLLALNAAVEAARAGEHGRGFAVVADEVRKLAERTSSATGEITGMIEGIQSETNEAVASMQKGTETVAEGREMAHQAGEALQGIVREVEQVEDRVSQIAAANEEQSTTSEQISRNVAQISEVTTDSAQGLNQISEALDELNRLSERLNQLTDEFEVEGKGSRSVAVGNGTTRHLARSV